MKKHLKKILWGVAGLFIFLIVALLAHPLWLGALGGAIAESSVSEMAKSEFTMDDLSVNLYSGHVRAEGIHLKNPVGDTSKDAVSVGFVDVTFDTMSMISDTQHIREIIVKDLHVNGTADLCGNLRQIAKNIEEYLEAHPKDPDAEESKLIIDRITFSGLKFTYGVLPIPLPDFTLTDIGKEEGGVNEEGAFDAIIDGICEAADKVSAGMGAILKGAIKGGGSVVDAAGAAIGKAGEIGGAAVDKAGEIGGAAVDKAGEIGGAAVDGVKKGLDGIKNLNPFK